MLLMDRDLALLTMAPCDVRARNRPIPVSHTPQRAQPTVGFTLFLHPDYIRFLIIVSKALKLRGGRDSLISSFEGGVETWW